MFKNVVLTNLLKKIKQIIYNFCFVSDILPVKTYINLKGYINFFSRTRLLIRQRFKTELWWMASICCFSVGLYDTQRKISISIVTPLHRLQKTTYYQQVDDFKKVNTTSKWLCIISIWIAWRWYSSTFFKPCTKLL